MPRSTEVLVIDAPARVHGTELNELVRRAETIIVPVLPSTIDIKACGHFMAELLEIGKVSRKQARLAVVANRVREYTLIYRGTGSVSHQAQSALSGQPARGAELRARLCARHGQYLELPEYLAWPDWKQWEPISAWLDSKRSQPASRASRPQDRQGISVRVSLSSPIEVSAPRRTSRCSMRRSTPA